MCLAVPSAQKEEKRIRLGVKRKGDEISYIFQCIVGPILLAKLVSCGCFQQNITQTEGVSILWFRALASAGCNKLQLAFAWHYEFQVTHSRMK